MSCEKLKCPFVTIFWYFIHQTIWENDLQMNQSHRNSLVAALIWSIYPFSSWSIFVFWDIKLMMASKNECLCFRWQISFFLREIQIYYFDQTTNSLNIDLSQGVIYPDYDMPACDTGRELRELETSSQICPHLVFSW